MAITALHSAASGLTALSTQIDVIANNLANANTQGFKGSRVNFEDLLYQEKQQPGVENADGDLSPAGLYVGTGVRAANTLLDFSVGSPVVTNRDLDVMIEGRGFFRVDTVESEGGGVAYTRAGNLVPNAEGDLVVGNSNGPRLVPPITLDGEYESIGVAPDGTVSVRVGGDPAPQVIGQILINNFINPQGLEPLGGNLYAETSASGPPAEGVPGEGNFGTLLQGAIESSNVDPVTELVGLIKAQRAFEMNSQTIQAADQTLQVVSNLRR